MKISPLEGWVFERIGANGTGLSRGHIEASQLERLRDTIDWAKARSPFYRKQLASLSGRDLVCLDDLAGFPFTMEQDIRRRPLRFLCISQSEVSRVVTLQTSGTTGDPKRIFFTADDQERTIDFFCRGMSTLAGPGDRVLILLPVERPGSVGDLLAKGLDRLGAVGIPHGPVKDFRETLAAMTLERVDTVVGIPVQVLALARLGNGRAAPRNVLLSTDVVPDAATRELRRIWGCEVFTHYGMTEMGYGGGVECQAHLGYHMREADLFFEIIDPATGSPMEEGKSGEVVFTTLTRRGMPLIRYRTGDISRFLPERCPCGTVLRSMQRVEGRIGGNVKLGATGFLSMTDLDEALFPLAFLLDFSAALTCENGKDRLHIEILAMGAGGERTGRLARSALDAIPVVRAAREKGALFVSIGVRREGQSAPGSMGKRRIIDYRYTNEPA